MVNFGTYLESFRNPAWAEYYVSYEALKRALYTLQDAVKRRDPGLGRGPRRCWQGQMRRRSPFARVCRSGAVDRAPGGARGPAGRRRVYAAA